MSERIEFLASFPAVQGAIKIDGGEGEGGRISLDVPGTDLEALRRLFDYRGKVLRVTVEAESDA